MSKDSIHTSGKYQEKEQKKLNKTSSYKSSQNKTSSYSTANTQKSSSVQSTSFSARSSGSQSKKTENTSSQNSAKNVIHTQKEAHSTSAYNPSRQYEQAQQSKHGYVNQIRERDSVRTSNAIHTAMPSKTSSGHNGTPLIKGGAPLSISEAGRRVIQKGLDSSGEIGLQAVSKGVVGANALKTYYQTVYKGTNLGIKVGKATGKTGYKIATGVARSTANTVSQVHRYGVKGTIHHRVNTSKINKHYRNSLKVAKVVGNKRTGKLERSIQVTKKDGRYFVKGAGALNVKMGRASLKTAVKSGHHIVKTATSQGLAVIEQGLDASDDLGAQAVSMGIKGARGTVAGVKVGATATRYTYRGVKTGVKAGVKTARTTGKAVRYVYKHGWKKSAQQLGKLAKNGAKNLLHGFTAVIKDIVLGAEKGLLAGAIGFLIPTLILNMSAPTMVMSVFFGGTGFNGDNTTWDVHDYVLAQTQSQVDAYADSVLDKYNELSRSGNYEIITMYNSLTGQEVAIDKNSIKGSIPTAEDFTEVIEPVYYVLMITRYEFSPTEAEKKETYNYLWGMINNLYTQKLSTVYCTASPDADGVYYAGDNCLRPSEQKHHPQDSGRSCCSTTYYCGGHTDYCVDGKNCAHSFGGVCQGVTSFCSGVSGCSNLVTEFVCYGYKECLGHRRIRIVLDFNGINALMAEEWGDKINELELKGSLTDAEIEELKTLKSDRQFCLDYVDFLGIKDENYNADYSIGFGGGGTPNIDWSEYEFDLSGDASIGASIARAGIQKVGCNYAWGGMTWCYDTSKAGSVGVDCSGFTYLIMKEHGINIPRTSAVQGMGGMPVASLADAKAGDLIFYGRSDVSGIGHVGIYIGNGQIVHASNPAPYPQGGVKISNATYKSILAIRRYW